jgi:hypothetical protein
LTDNVSGRPDMGIKPADPAGTALVRRSVESWKDPDWQRLWLTIEKQSWHTLSIIPAGEGADPDFTISLAVTLSRTGMTHLGRPIQVADGTQVALSQLNGFLMDVQACTSAGDRLLVALPPITSSPTAPAIAKATDAAVLCVLMERMSWVQARQTIRLVGTSRFLGSIIIKPDGSPSAK